MESLRGNSDLGDCHAGWSRVAIGVLPRFAPREIGRCRIRVRAIRGECMNPPIVSLRRLWLSEPKSKIQSRRVRFPRTPLPNNGSSKPDRDASSHEP